MSYENLMVVFFLFDCFFVSDMKAKSELFMQHQIFTHIVHFILIYSYLYHICYVFIFMNMDENRPILSHKNILLLSLGALVFLKMQLTYAHY